MIFFCLQNPFTDILSAALDESGITGDEFDFSAPEPTPEPVQYAVSSCVTPKKKCQCICFDCLVKYFDMKEMEMEYKRK